MLATATTPCSRRPSRRDGIDGASRERITDDATANATTPRSRRDGIHGDADRDGIHDDARDRDDANNRFQITCELSDRTDTDH